jgi:HAD superfamily hydrolase (TIGR01509 family)
MARGDSNHCETGLQMSDAGSPAVLFDLDGTLVDTNFHHAVAWQRAFADVGRHVSCWRIIELLGRSGDELIAESIGDELAESSGDDAKDSHDRYFGEYEPVLQTTAGARDLLQAITDEGWQTVLATSAGEKTLKLLRRILEADDLIGHVTSSADAERGKPHPDIVSTALERAKIGADDAIFVGDAVWDMQAGKRAGVPTVGLLSGGASRKALLDAGAVAIYDDPRDILANFSDFIKLRTAT